MAEARVSALYRRYGGVIYSRCRRLLRDDALSEDATQEVFVKVLKHIESAPDDAEVLRWIYRISTNHCLNILRRRGQNAPLSDDGDDLQTQSLEQLLLDRDEALRVLERAPQKLRAPALLYYVDGLPQDEVAKVLGVTRRTVINRLGEFLVRSRKLLRREAP